jgi:hypothetical protein
VTPAAVVEGLWRADDITTATDKAIRAGLTTGDPTVLVDALAALLAARVGIPIREDGARDDVRTLYLALLTPLTTDEADDAWCELTRADWESRQTQHVDRRLIAHVPAAVATYDRRAAELAELAVAVPAMTLNLARKVVDLRARLAA